MNIRKFWRLSCLTVASFFWASCTESNPQFPMAQAANPDSSADVGNLSSASSEVDSSALVEPVSSSSQTAEQTQGSEEGLPENDIPAHRECCIFRDC